MHSPSFSKNIFGIGLAFGLVLSITTALAGALYTLQIRDSIEAQVQQIDHLTQRADALATEIFDRNGNKIGEFAGERRFYLRLEQIPKSVIQAFLSAEDKDFYHHLGISPSAILRAALVNLRGGRVRQGASTITQQLARLYFLDQSKTWQRKAKEAVLAVAIERRLTKDQILELYLNKIYLGNGSYGVEAAARNYFRKNARQLNLGEAALIAGLAKSPTAYAPHKHRSVAEQRQRVILARLSEDGYITRTTATMWAQQKVEVASGPEDYSQTAPYFIGAVAQELSRKFGTLALAREGLKIYTTLDSNLQNSADRELVRFIREARRKERSANSKLKNPSDELQGALVSIDPRSGGILAMQGGGTFQDTQFNRTAATNRPLGALFLPIYVGLALESGYQLSSRVGDEPLANEKTHTEKSLSDSGMPTLMELLRSGDVSAGVPLFAALGQGSVRHFAQRLGLKFGPSDFSLAIGSGSASPTQAAVAFAAFINGGQLISPYLIERIVDARGQLMYQYLPNQSEPVMTTATASAVLSGLRSALAEGHAKGAQGVSALAAGMAAVTEDLHNAWFVGLTPTVVSTLWLGAEHGSAKVAATHAEAVAETSRAWAAFMRSAPTSLDGPDAAKSMQPHPEGAYKLDGQLPSRRAARK
jgi:penicillin-binding protein 1A